ncbi:MAG: Mrp/NBP35 family ATP-binding protein [Chloroflexi bacterium]|nr:Mrp/NBP35 family ATP-binding protein [Chloroflexota bacterium]
MITEQKIREALKGVIDPELRKSIVELGMVRDIVVKDGKVRFRLALTTLACPLKDKIVQDAKAAVLALESVQEVEVEVTEMTAEEREQVVSAQEATPLAAHLNDIRHTIAVMSGKGGVGKSLVTALLAVGLRHEGHRVGILDADITGPSIPKMFGLADRPSQSPLGILPVRSKLGIGIMSINLLLPFEDAAVIWRGPLISGAIKQFWGDVFWGDLDYLLVDLPPGTADAPLTVMQSLPLNGVVLVTSPQELAGMVVRKAAQMASQLQVPILGLIENMSYFQCPDNDQPYDIFGPSHAEETARRLGVPLLGRLPIEPRLSQLCDQGAIEAYPTETFAPIVARLIEVIPERKTTPLFS